LLKDSIGVTAVRDAPWPDQFFVGKPDVLATFCDLGHRYGFVAGIDAIPHDRIRARLAVKVARHFAFDIIDATPIFFSRVFRINE
jgi:hypothetical protein